MKTEELKKLMDWLCKEIAEHSRKSALHANAQHYESAQYEDGIAEGLQLVFDKLYKEQLEG